MGTWKRLVVFSDLSRQELNRILPPDREDDPATRADQALLAEAITRGLAKLGPEYRAVLVLRYGLHGAQPHSLEEAARTLGHGRERIRAMELAGVRRLGYKLLLK